MPALVSSFIPAAGDTPDRGGRDGVIELWQVLSTLADPRDRRGVRHDLATVLTLAVAGVSAGARSLVAIAEWAADLPRAYWSRFGVRRCTPSAATFSRLLARVDADVLDAVLGAWTTAAAGDLARQTPIAVDGKSARGARRGDGSRVHLFAAITHGTAIPLGQVAAATKGYEIAAFATVLDRVDLHGRIVTADALHTQRSHAHYLHRHGGHYVFTVKRNQPSLHERLAALPWAQVPIGHVSLERGHGRTEHRTVQLISAVHPRLGFPHARLAARIVRTRTTSAGVRTREVVYAISDLSAEQADAARIGELVRGHWVIENQLHWIRDVTLGEDAHQLRTGTAPQAMATLRNTALALLRIAGAPTISTTTAALSRRVRRVLTVLDPQPRTTLTSRQGRL